MCESIILSIVITIALIPILLSICTSMFLNNWDLRINSVYTTFLKNSLKANISNIIHNDILNEKIINNFELLIDTIYEDTYKNVFNNTNLYQHKYHYFNLNNNITNDFFKNKNGIDKLIFNEFYLYLYNLNNLYFTNIFDIYSNYSNHKRYNNFFNIIIDAWSNNDIEFEYIKVYNKLVDFLNNNTVIQNANENFNCFVIINSKQCPNNFIKYFSIKNYNVFDNTYYSKKFNYLKNRNIIECCNY